MKNLILAIALAVSPVLANAQIIHFLVKDWVERGERFCKYDNGTVLNVGINLCPLTI